MMFPSIFTSALAVGLASAAVLPRASVPGNDGFPNSNAAQQKAIGQKAGGLLPNGPLPKPLGKNSITAFQLIAFNELFETAYFSSLLANITNNVPGYQVKGDNKDLIKTFETIVAQEEIHALGATGILKNVGAFAPTACQYKFPVSDLRSSILIAETFTAVVLGALQQANTLFTMDGEAAPVQLISSVIGQEGEQNGFYRALLQQVASESPFLTTVPPPFAFSALQMFVVPGSCPYPLSNIGLPILPPIMTNGGPVAVLDPKDQLLSFTADLTNSPNAQKYIGGNGKGLALTYGTGQQLPISVPLTNVKFVGKTISFQATFPYAEHVMQGFSHGALTIGSSFSDVNAVASASLAGPAIIQVKNNVNTNLLASYGMVQTDSTASSTSSSSGGCAAKVAVGDSNVVELC